MVVEGVVGNAARALAGGVLGKGGKEGKEAWREAAGEREGRERRRLPSGRRTAGTSRTMHAARWAVQYLSQQGNRRRDTTSGLLH